MSVERRWGFAVVGCGVIGPHHVRAIRALPRAELIGVVDVVPERAQQLADESDCKWFSDLDDVLDLDEVDVVSIGVPTGLHAEIGCRAAGAGKHVVVEKPIDVSLAAADRLIEACEQAGVKLAVVSQCRFEPAVRFVRSIIDQGELGDLVLASATLKFYRSQAYYDSADWRGTWSLDGGGATMNQGVHYVDLMRWFMGPVESVTAVYGTKAHSRIEVEDIALATLKFTSGALGILEATTVAYPGLPPRLAISGTRGSIVLEEEKLVVGETLGEDGAARHLEIAEDVQARVLSAVADNTLIDEAGHQVQFEDFITALENGRDPFVTGVDGREAVEVIFALYESARSGKTVSLAEAAATPERPRRAAS